MLFRDNLQKCFVFPRKVREGRQVFNDGRLKLFLQQRKKFLANSRPRSLRVAVGGIFAPGLFLRAQKTSKLASANAQRGTNHRPRDGMNSSKACEACPTQDVREHGLRLVVSRMSHRDSRARSGFCQRTEIVVARSSRRVL